MTRATLGLGLALTCWGCDDVPLDADPARAAQAFVERMQRVHGEPGAARAAYELLDRDARRNLAERAERASALAGRKLAPEEMLAPSRFSLRGKPQRYFSRVDGERAVVEVTGDEADHAASVVECRREDGHWRVVLELPALSPIQARPDSAGSARDKR